MRPLIARLVFIGLVGILFPGCPATPVATVYYLVADPNHPEAGSYILPLTDSEAIAHADAVIADPEGTDLHLVVATIASGGTSGEYVNRDLMGTGSTWSWHIASFLGFADYTVEILDGNAHYVEDQFSEWCRITGSTIGFWSYRVIRRVDVSEMGSR